MSHTLQNIIGIVLLAAVFIFTRYGIGRKMKQSAQDITEELNRQGALGSASAVHLPWAKPNLLKFGFRDFRPKVLKDLVTAGIVGKTEDEKYYLLRQY